MSIINHKSIKMKKLLFLFFISAITIACTNVKHAEFEKNTEIAKAFFKAS